jgi:proteasome lid subunit RPN8/RPN11
MKITTSAFNTIVKTLGSITAEQGGIGVGKDGIVTDFIHDVHARTTGGTYELNTPYLNPKLKEFDKQNKELLAIIHSHPNGYSKLSPQDRKYFKSQFKNFPDLEKLYTSIIFSAKDGEFHFYPYAMYRDGTVKEEKLEIVPDNYMEFLTKKTIVEKKEQVEIPAKKETVHTQTEVIKTEKEVVINFHNSVTQKGRLDPVTIFSDDDKKMEKEEEKLEKESVVEEVIITENPLEKTLFNKIYHGFFMALLLYVFVMLLFLSPEIYQFFTNLLNQ